jgi:acetyl-CoA carboxylase carboxyl transferase subunit alpha
LQDALKQVSALSTAEMLEARFERLMAYGRTKEQPLR